MNQIQTNYTATSQMDTIKSIIQHHLGAFLENNIEALMADYTRESVFITPDRSYAGLEEIRNFFVDLMSHFPTLKSTIELENTVVDDELGYIVWHGKSESLNVPFASDTFLVKDGKILRQTFAGQLKFI